MKKAGIVSVKAFQTGKLSKKLTLPVSFLYWSSSYDNIFDKFLSKSAAEFEHFYFSGQYSVKDDLLHHAVKVPFSSFKSKSKREIQAGPTGVSSVLLNLIISLVPSLSYSYWNCNFLGKCFLYFKLEMH